MHFPRLIENVPFDRQSEAVLRVRGGDVTCLPLHVDARIPHGHRQPGLAEHREVILRVPQHRDRVTGNAELIRKGIDESSFVEIGRRYVEILRLGAGD